MKSQREQDTHPFHPLSPLHNPTHRGDFSNCDWEEESATYVLALQPEAQADRPDAAQQYDSCRDSSLEQAEKQTMCGFDFHRQKPIDEFVVDFFCPKLLLAIEIDGDSHAGKLERDSQRQRAIEKFGVRFLRFSDEEVKQNLESVVDVLAHWVETQGMSQIEAADEEQPKN